MDAWSRVTGTYADDCIGRDVATRASLVEAATGLLRAWSTHQSGCRSPRLPSCGGRCAAPEPGFRVTKNRLARRALVGTAFEPLSPLFTGPTAVAFSHDPVAAAKVVVEYANRNDKLTIVGGGLAGQQMDAGWRSGRWPACPRSTSCAVSSSACLQAPATQLASRAAGPSRADCARVLAVPCRARRRGSYSLLR